MGRNYTIYIKHDAFDTEPNKSGLVNQLLKKHYFDNTTKETDPIPDTKPPLSLNDVKEIKAKQANMKMCPNGHPIPEGRSKCMGKGCKHA